MTKYKVPDGMLKAFGEAYRAEYGCLPHSEHMRKINRALEAAIRWLAENPIVPTREQLRKLDEDLRRSMTPALQVPEKSIPYIAEWQRHMFVEPEVPEDIENLLWGDWQRKQGLPEHLNGWMTVETHNSQVIEAYKRGKASK